MDSVKEDVTSLGVSQEHAQARNRQQKIKGQAAKCSLHCKWPLNCCVYVLSVVQCCDTLV